MRRTPFVASLGLAMVAAAIAVPTTFAQASDHKPIARPTDPVARAAAAADKVAASGLDKLRKGPDERFRRVDVVRVGRPDLNFYHVTYERTYKGVPVVGGGATVVTDAAGRVVHTAGPGATEPLATVEPRVAPSRASATAKARLSKAVGASKPRLVVLAEPGKSELAWETVVRGTRNRTSSVLHVFTDAATGKVLDQYDDVRAGTSNGFFNGVEEINTSGSAGSFQLADTTRNGLRCGGQNGSTYTDADDTWGNGSGTDLVTACGDAMYAAQQQGESLKNWMSYNGINGNGQFYPARVGLNQVNAFWNGSYANFGHNQANTRQATPIDVVAHEFGHGVFQFAGTDGSGSGAERGGMNESTGDIFGAIAEHYAASVDSNGNDDPPDYLVGEEVDLVGQGPIRNMYDPSALGDPNCYPELNSGTEVHAGAGPQNHWFVLLANGSNPSGGPTSPICGGGSAITGIGIQKAAAIFMSALATKNPSTWNHRVARTETLAAAKRLFPGSCTEYNTVQAAWNGIQVPAGTGESCSTQPGDHWSMTLTPASGTAAPGASVTTTVATATTQGSPQSITFGVSGLPTGVTATIEPKTVQSGNSVVVTIATSATTPEGTSTVTIAGDGASEDHTATFALTVGSPTTGCGGLPETFSGTLSGAGASQYWPGTAGWTAKAGTFRGCLDGPASVDYDLYLQRQSTFGWTTVARGTSPDPDEDVTYNGSAGTYRWRVYSYSGNGAYTFSMNRP